MLLTCDCTRSERPSDVHGAPIVVPFQEARRAEKSTSVLDERQDDPQGERGNR